MKRFLILGGFLLGATLLAPLATANDKRYYDRDGHDYHVYNNQEDKAYRAYLGEQRKNYREFRKTNRNDQQQYFKWRHEHPDSTLFKLEIK